MRAAAENLTSVTLELGGKSPCIVGEDADLAAAVESIMYGKLLNAGQACVAPDYVFVPEARREEFAQLAGEAARRLYPHVSGNPDYTTIINDHHYRRIIACLREARAAGTRVVELVAEEAMPGSHDRRITPTLVVCPGDDLAIMRDEIFGPVLVLKTYTRLDEAIDYINRRPRPLALYYFGAKTTLRDRVLGRTVSGGVTVNDTVLHAGVEALPFGGVGLSGIGAYHGKAGFETFSHGKSVFLQARPSVARLLRPPFGRLTDLILRLLIR
jgi:coniferyl-aldehyde dehydrogenase